MSKNARLWRAGMAACSAWLMVGLCSGCNSKDAAGQAGPPASPVDVAKTLRALQRERKYMQFGTHVVLGQRGLLVDTLMAIDRLLDANRRAQQRIAALHGEMVAGEFDLSGLEDHIGLFSRFVEFSGERLEGDRAVVVAQVSNRLPHEEYQFVLQDGRWLYAPSSPNPELPGLIGSLASSVEVCARELERGDLTLEEIRSEFAGRVFRKVKAMRDAVSVARPATSTLPSSGSRPGR